VLARGVNLGVKARANRSRIDLRADADLNAIGRGRWFSVDCMGAMQEYFVICEG
jgi:hypothetical protein